MTANEQNFPKYQSYATIKSTVLVKLSWNNEVIDEQLLLDNVFLLDFLI